MIQINNEKAYTVQETADILKVLPGMIRHYIKKEKLKATPIGRSYYINENSLKEFWRRKEGKE